MRKVESSLRIGIVDGAKAVKEATAEYKKFGDEVSRIKMENAIDGLNEMKDGLNQVRTLAKSTSAELNNTLTTQSKVENQAGGTMSTLAKAGLVKMVGDSLTTAANVGISSAFGTNMGNAISTALNGAISGVAMGSIAGLPGAIGGAVVGLAAGGINGLTQMFAAEDDAFKGVVQEMTTAQWQRQTNDIRAGSDIAAIRELDSIAFNTLIGNEEAAQQFQQDMIRFGNTTPFDYNQLSSMSRVLLTYGYDLEEGDLNIFDQMSIIGNAGAALNLGQDGMDTVATTLGRMNSRGAVNQRYIQSLEERGISATAYLAEEILGEDTAENQAKITKMITDNLIDGREAAKAISDLMSRDYDGIMNRQAVTFSGLMSTLQDMNEEMQNAMGEGYHEIRKEGIQAQISYLDAVGGEQMKEANRLIGEWQGKLVNDEEQYQRDAMTAVMDGQISAFLSANEQNQELNARLMELSGEYQKAMAEDDGAEMGRILAESRILAQAEYNASEGAQLELASQRSLIENTRSALVNDETYYNAGYALGQEFSRGIMAARSENALKEMGPMATFEGRIDEEVRLANEQQSHAFDYSPSPGAAYGLSYVPYDDYSVRLHEGERVLTAQEARQQNHSSTQLPPITGNNFYIREEADIDKVAQVLFTKIQQAQLIS